MERVFLHPQHVVTNKRDETWRKLGLEQNFARVQGKNFAVIESRVWKCLQLEISGRKMNQDPFTLTQALIWRLCTDSISAIHIQSWWTCCVIKRREIRFAFKLCMWLGSKLLIKNSSSENSKTRFRRTETRNWNSKLSGTEKSSRKATNAGVWYGCVNEFRRNSNRGLKMTILEISAAEFQWFPTSSKSRTMFACKTERKLVGNHKKRGYRGAEL